MVGELIKEYLVGLGVKIDKPGFNEMKSTLDQTGNAVASTTGGWAKNFVMAGTIIATAVAGITASIAGVMTAAAKQDLVMEKYARSMMMSKGAALELKTAVDALGESIQDIQLSPELMNRYRSLVSDGRQMKVGGDYEGTMKGFRGLIFEFTRLKQEAAYALQWVGYYLMKYLSRPLAEAKASFKSFNDSVIKNMPVWTEKIARALVYIINVGKHFWDLLKAIGKTIYDVWDAIPNGVKIATAALAGFILMLKATPLYRIIALMSALLLLADDYFGYMEGKNAAMGPIWDKLNKYMDKAKQKMEEWGKVLSPVWDKFVGYLGEALEKQGSAKTFTDLMQRLWDIFLGLVDAISEGTEIIAEWFKEMGRSAVVRELIDAVVDLFDAIMELFTAVLDLCNVALGEFFKGMDNTEPVYSFKDAVKAVTEFISAMIRTVADLIRWLGKLFDMVKTDKSFKEYWKAQGEAVRLFSDIVFRALGAVGKLGKALLALMSNKPGYAAKLAGEAIDALFGGGKAEASGRRRGSGFAGTGDEERDAWIKEASKKYGVPASKIAAMIDAESAFDPNAVSPGVGAIGYMQLMPETFKWMGFDDINDSYQNIMAGTKYMAYLRDYYNSDWDKVYGSYNCGPGAFDAFLAGKKDIPTETRNHIERVRDRESKYWGNQPTDISYSIQAGVEDNDLNGVNPNLRGNFNELAADLHDQGYEVEVSSGARSKENNANAGGVPDSNHLAKEGWGSGQAIDFVIKGEFDQAEIEKIIQQYGMKALYHDAGSGLHFHIETDPNAQQYEIRNPYEGIRDPTWFDELSGNVKTWWNTPTAEAKSESPTKSTLENTGVIIGSIKKIGQVVTDAGGKLTDFVSEIGGTIKGNDQSADSISKGLVRPSSYLQDSFAKADPLVMRGLANQQQPPYYTSNYGSNSSMVYNVEVGGVVVTNTNAAPNEIGKAVGDGVISKLELNAIDICNSRTLTVSMV